MRNFIWMLLIVSFEAIGWWNFTLYLVTKWHTDQGRIIDISCLMARLCPDQSFMSSCHRHHIAVLYMLYNLNSNSNDYFFSELPSASTRVRHVRAARQLIHCGSKYQGVERPNLQGLSCRPRFVSGMTFPSLSLVPERRMGLIREQSTVGCFPELWFSVLSGSGACGVVK